jgi:hypothetical protein
MYRPQLKAMARLLSASVGSARGCAAICFHQPVPLLISSQTTTSTVLQMMRWQ